MQDNAERYSTIHYRNYLGLDKILNAQDLRSAMLEENPAHEEMLFIIVHQVYELWFKQIIHELESVLEMFDKDNVDEKNIGTSTHRLERVIEIQKLLVAQIRVIETMTPLDFLDFRNYLFPASGFQSFQFRMVENLLGLPEENRLTYNGCPYFSVFSEPNQKKLKEVTAKGSLFDAVHKWLERTPFLQIGEFNFLQQYKAAVSKMIEKEEKAIKSSPYLDTHEMEMRLQMLGNTDTYFQSVLDEKRHNTLVEKGELRMSYKATLAALLINLYRDEPLLHLPFKLLTCLIEIDDALTTWRYRHAQMVQRMLGNKIGTGGSSGFAYLSETAVKHPIFKDLHNISTLLIPRSELPELPKEIKEALGFYFSSRKNDNNE